jgi:hypothetical protein
MTKLNPYDLINERERLKRDQILSNSSSMILSYEEKKRRESIVADNIARLLNDGKSVIGQEFSSSGKISNISDKTIFVDQKNSVTTFDYSGKQFKKSCIISIQFQSSSKFDSFITGDKVYFTGKILKINVDPNSRFSSSVDITIENISFQKQVKSEGACFIATAVYGNYDIPAVRDLRRFRDLHLLSSRYGRLFVKIYYKVSPPIAVIIKRSKILKFLVKYFLLNPFCFFVRERRKL